MPENSSPARAYPTQVSYPWKAAVRTMFQTGLALLFAVPTIFEAVRQEFGDLLPASVWPTLAIVSAFAVAIAGALSRIMAIGAVNDALSRVGLGAEPR